MLVQQLEVTMFSGDTHVYENYDMRSDLNEDFREFYPNQGLVKSAVLTFFPFTQMETTHILIWDGVVCS